MLGIAKRVSLARAEPHQPAAVPVVVEPEPSPAQLALNLAKATLKELEAKEREAEKAVDAATARFKAAPKMETAGDKMIAEQQLENVKEELQAAHVRVGDAEQGERMERFNGLGELLSAEHCEKVAAPMLARQFELLKEVAELSAVFRQMRIDARVRSYQAQNLLMEIWDYDELPHHGGARDPSSPADHVYKCAYTLAGRLRREAAKHDKDSLLNRELRRLAQAIADAEAFRL